MAKKFKNIRIKKKGGGTRLQRVQVLKSGKFKFVKNIKKGKGSTKKKATKNKTTKKKTTKKKTTTKKQNKSGGKKMTKKRSLLGMARLSVFVLAVSGKAINIVTKQGFTKEAANTIAANYTGRNVNTGKLDMGVASATYGPAAAFAVIDTVASKAGVYKRLGNL